MPGLWQDSGDTGPEPRTPRIVSVSRRTDVPAFYADWFLGRVRAGFCEWVNPFGGQRQRVSLRPEHVAAFVFWTRNPEPLLPHLDWLEQQGYTFYFHMTINGYPRSLEPFRPAVRRSVERFRALADRVGPHRVFWRYDPIVTGVLLPQPDRESVVRPNEAARERPVGGAAPRWGKALPAGELVLDEAYHLPTFEQLARSLQGYTRRCYFSFVAPYRKTRRNLARVLAGPHGVEEAAWPLDRRRRLAGELAAIAGSYGITLYSCCDDSLLSDDGLVGGPRPVSGGGAAGDGVLPDGIPVPPAIRKARCVDPDVVRALRPDLQLRLKARPTRDQCGCVESVDIGAYDTCLMGCAYCYATRSVEVARGRYRRHEPGSASLL